MRTEARAGSSKTRAVRKGAKRKPMIYSCGGKKSARIPAKWLKIIRAIPGYDAVATATKGMYFDGDAAQLSLDFFPECLTHVKGPLSGKPFELILWEQAIVACIFGWKRPDGTRRYREVMIYLPRKNGKTTLAAGIALEVLFCDGEAGAEIYSAASEAKQAGIIFDIGAAMVRNEPTLSDCSRIYGGGPTSQSKAIVRDDLSGSWKVLSADVKSKHGFNVHCAVVDELHAMPNRDLVDTLLTGTGSRAQPLIIYTTTSDIERESVCNEKVDYAQKVRDMHVDDASFLPILYGVTKEDDWKLEATWKQANPNYGISLRPDYIEREFKRAVETPGYENTFKRLHLNLRTEQVSRWLSMDHWRECAHGVKDPRAWRQEMLVALQGRQCYGGLDLGSTSDLTALVLLFEMDDEPDIMLPWFWCPQRGAKAKDNEYRDLYDAWNRAGFLEYTPGNVADYDQIRAEIGDVADHYGVRDLAVDRLFQGAQLCTQLMDDGLNVIAFGQGFLSMAAPTKEFEERVINHAFNHGGNPILHWMASNVCIIQDKVGNMKPTKPTRSSPLKVDGIVAAIMALGRLTAQPAQTVSAYEDPEYGL